MAKTGPTVALCLESNPPLQTVSQPLLLSCWNPYWNETMTTRTYYCFSKRYSTLLTVSGAHQIPDLFHEAERPVAPVYFVYGKPNEDEANPFSGLSSLAICLTSHQTALKGEPLISKLAITMVTTFSAVLATHVDVPGQSCGLRWPMLELTAPFSAVSSKPNPPPSASISRRDTLSLRKCGTIPEHLWSDKSKRCTELQRKSMRKASDTDQNTGLEQGLWNNDFRPILSQERSCDSVRPLIPCLHTFSVFLSSFNLKPLFPFHLNNVLGTWFLKRNSYLFHKGP